MQTDGTGLFGLPLDLPPFSWWMLLPFALIWLLAAMAAFGYFERRGGRQAGPDPAAHLPPGEASNDPLAAAPPRSAAE